MNLTWFEMDSLLRWWSPYRLLHNKNNLLANDLVLTSIYTAATSMPEKPQTQESGTKQLLFCSVDRVPKMQHFTLYT